MKSWNFEIRHRTTGTAIPEGPLYSGTLLRRRRPRQRCRPLGPAPRRCPWRSWSIGASSFSPLGLQKIRQRLILLKLWRQVNLIMFSSNVKYENEKFRWWCNCVQPNHFVKPLKTTRKPLRTTLSYTEGPVSIPLILGLLLCLLFPCTRLIVKTPNE